MIQVSTMKKILIVLVGGTICTEVKDNVRTINKSAGALLTNCFYNSHPEYDDSFDLFEESENFEILSENMTIEKWNDLIRYFAENLYRFNQYSGIIIAHGTDTLAYSSSIFSILLNSTPIPVFFVASNEPLSSQRANGNANFKVATECILNGINPGVYVAYQNPADEQMYIHKGSQLIQCSNYDENFYSKNAIKASCVTSQYIEQINCHFENNTNTRFNNLLLDVYNKKLFPCILCIQPYVGLDYSAFNYGKFKAVLHGTYHSGTSCVEQTEHSEYYTNHSILKMIDICDECRVDVYYSPSFIEGEVYDTIPIIANHKVQNGTSVNFVYGMTNEMTYCKLLIAYSLGYSQEEIDVFLTTNIVGEIAYKA